MSEARDVILNRVKQSLKVPAQDFKRENAIKLRLKRHSANLIPDRTQGSDEDRVALFRSMLEKCQTDVVELGLLSDVPGAIAGYLREHNLPAQVQCGDDAALAALDWSDTTVDVGHGRALGQEQVGLSRAECGVAETGTLVLRSGPDNPTSINFLPETHVVLVSREDISGPYEPAWDRLRAIYGEGKMPRTVNLVSGPSRTGDIEQKIVNGAHGPKRLLVVIVNERLAPQDP